MVGFDGGLRGGVVRSGSVGVGGLLFLFCCVRAGFTGGGLLFVCCVFDGEYVVREKGEVSCADMSSVGGGMSKLSQSVWIGCRG